MAATMGELVGSSGTIPTVFSNPPDRFAPSDET